MSNLIIIEKLKIAAMQDKLVDEISRFLKRHFLRFEVVVAEKFRK